MKPLVLWVVRNRLLTLAVVLIFTGVAGIWATKVSFNSSIEMWFLDDDPNIKVYNEFSEQFGGDEIAIIGVAAKDVLAEQVLETVARLTDASEKAPHVDEVRSLTNTPFEKDSEINKGWIISEDHSSTAVIVAMKRSANNVDSKTEMVAALRKALEEERGRISESEIELFLSGTPVIDEAFFRYNNRDTMRLFPFVMALVLLIGVLSFRRFSLGVLPLVVVLVAVAWVFGIMGALGLKTNILSSILPPLLLAIGVADSVHVITDYQRHLVQGEKRDTAIVNAISHIFQPCLFTSITTSAGLLALLVSPIGPVREFGVLVAIGVMVAFLLSMLFLPALLALLPAPVPRVADSPSADRFLKLLLRAGMPSPGGARLIAGIALALVVFSGWSLTQLKIGVLALSWFPQDDPVVSDTNRVDKELGGSSSLEFLITAPGGGLKNPDQLKRLYEFERWLEEEFTSISKVLSIADLHHNFSSSGLPLVVQLAAFEQRYPKDFQRLVQGDFSRGRITARIRLGQSKELVHRIDEVEQKLARDLNRDGLKVEMTGYARLMGEMQDYLLQSQIQSLLLAFVVITILLVVLLRSWKLGLLAMIPNITPILVGLGAMPLLGISLNPGTIMIGAIALGLVVDDSVHFLVALRRNFTPPKDLDAAINAAIRETGRPIVITSLTLMSGFAVLAFGSFNPNIQFGIVSTLVIALALVADLILLPALLRLFMNRSLKIG